MPFVWCLLALAVFVLPGRLAAQCTGCPYPYSTTWAGVTFDESTYEEHGVIEGGDIYYHSWASDGNVYVMWGDGEGWNENMTSATLGTNQITNSPPGLTANNGTGISPATKNRKPLGFVADAAGVWNGFWQGEAAPETIPFDGSWLITSPDQGVTLTDTSTRLWSWATDGVQVGGMLQVDQGYTGSPPGVDLAYYYIMLGTRKNTPQGQVSGNQNFYLARVLKANVATIGSYEYFAGADGSNEATWTSTFANKQPFFIDANQYTALMSMSYWPEVGRWFFLKQHSGDHKTMGLFEAPRPWGPWGTLYYGQFRDTLVKFNFEIPTKWTSSDGVHFYLSWSGWPVRGAHYLQGTLVSSGDVLPPKAPTGLQATTTSASRIDLQWTAPSQNIDDSPLTDLVGYELWWCDATAVPACTPDTLEFPDLGLVTTYAKTSGLTPGTTYRFGLKAKDVSQNRSALSGLNEAPTASVQTLAMSATSTPNTWTTGPTTGQNKVTYVATDDGATTYIASSTTAGVQQQYAITDPTGLAAGDVIQLVRLRAVARKIVTTTGTTLILTAVLGGSTTPLTCTLATQNVWQDCLLDMPTKPGGGAWTAASLTDLEVRVQNGQARVTQVTLLEMTVTYIPDPPPRAVTNLSGVATDGTTVQLTWSHPTQSTDGSPLTDLAGYRIAYCNVPGSCLPNLDITPDLGVVTTYTHEDLTTNSDYNYTIRAKDTAGHLSVASEITMTHPTTELPYISPVQWRWGTPGIQDAQGVADERTAHEVRFNGGVRLRVQFNNTGSALITQGYPLECRQDTGVGFGAYATLTDSCASTGLCLRNIGGYADGATLSRVFAMPPGISWSGSEGARFVSSTTWTPVPMGPGQAAELAYEVGTSGLALGTVVCCRPTLQDEWPNPPGDACFTASTGMASQ